MTALSPSGVFVMVDPVHVATVGAPAALVFSRICWRAEREGSWRATRKIVSAETGLSPEVVRTALRVLRDQEWVTAERAGGYDRAWVWTPLLPAHIDSRESPSSMEVRSPDVSLETVETTTPPTADAVIEEPAVMEYADDEGLPLLMAVPDLPAEPVETGPPKTAQTLVARWVDGYRVTNAGQDPPRPLLKRVAGQMGRLAKDCGDEQPSWSAAWQACYAAGQEGRVDAVQMMSRRPQRGRANHDLANLAQMAAAPGLGSAVTAGALAMLNPSSNTNPPGGRP